MSSGPQPGDVYEEPSGLIVLVLRLSDATNRPIKWWECVVLCDYPRGTVPAGYQCDYPLEHVNADWVRISSG